MISCWLLCGRTAKATIEESNYIIFNTSRTEPPVASTLARSAPSRGRPNGGNQKQSNSPRLLQRNNHQGSRDSRRGGSSRNQRRQHRADAPKRFSCRPGLITDRRCDACTQDVTFSRAFSLSRALVFWKRKVLFAEPPPLAMNWKVYLERDHVGNSGGCRICRKLCSGEARRKLQNKQGKVQHHKAKDIQKLQSARTPDREVEISAEADADVSWGRCPSRMFRTKKWSNLGKSDQHDDSDEDSTSLKNISTCTSTSTGVVPKSSRS